MKNKKKLILLLASTILVWGFLIYKVFFSKDDQTGAISTGKINTLPLKETKEDISEPLILDYVDPFLKTAVVSRKKSRQTTNKKPPTIRKVSWPRIKYTGMVQNMITNEIRANISINNKNYILKQEDVKSEITVKEIQPDFIILSKNNVLKTIKKPK